MKTLIYILVMSLCSSPAFAEKVYKHTSPDGIVTYSDEPAEGSQEIVLPKPQTYSLPKSNRSFQKLPEESEETKKVSYSVKINSPSNEHTVTMGQDSLDVTVDVSPTLSEGHGIQLFLDSEPLGEPGVKTTFIITQLFRGTHQLQAKIIHTQSKKVIKESEPVTFYVQRSTVKNE